MKPTVYKSWAGWRPPQHLHSQRYVVGLYEDIWLGNMSVGSRNNLYDPHIMLLVSQSTFATSSSISRNLVFFFFISPVDMVDFSAVAPLLQPLKSKST